MHQSTFLSSIEEAANHIRQGLTYLQFDNFHFNYIITRSVVEGKLKFCVDLSGLLYDDGNVIEAKNRGLSYLQNTAFIEPGLALRLDSNYDLASCPDELPGEWSTRVLKWCADNVKPRKERELALMCVTARKLFQSIGHVDPEMETSLLQAFNRLLREKGYAALEFKPGPEPVDDSVEIPF